MRCFAEIKIFFLDKQFETCQTFSGDHNRSCNVQKIKTSKILHFTRSSDGFFSSEGMYYRFRKFVFAEAREGKLYFRSGKKIAAPQTLKTRQLSLSTRDYTYCHDVPSECAFFANQVQGWCGCKKKFTSLGFFAAESI